MKNNRSIIWIVIVVLFVLLQYRGYYIRNLRVSDEYLELIVEKMVLLEDKRINNKIHSPKSDLQLDDEVNFGEAAKSRIGMELSIKVRVMSTCLREYYDALFIPDTQKAAEALEKYFKKLSELEELLSDFKGKRPEVDILWEKGIFK